MSDLKRKQPSNVDDLKRRKKKKRRIMWSWKPGSSSYTEEPRFSSSDLLTAKTWRFPRSFNLIPADGGTAHINTARRIRRILINFMLLRGIVMHAKQDLNVLFWGWGMCCVMFDLFKHSKWEKSNLNLRFSCLISLESISWFDLIFFSIARPNFQICGTSRDSLVL